MYFVICSIMTLQFAIVEFVSSKSVASIPSTWFVTGEEDECFYPKMADKKRLKLIKERSEALTSWPKYEVRVLGKAGSSLLNVLCLIFNTKL